MKGADVSEEYQALRQEILEWQTRRFTIVSGAIVVVTAVLGWITQNPDEWPWAIASTVLLAPLACACYLTWLFGSFNTRLGTYVEVFHESTEGRSGWEKRNREFRTGREILNLNTALALVYLVLGGVSVCVPIAVAKGDTSGFQFAVFALSATVFVSTILLVALHSYPRDDYVTKWKGIK